MEIKKNTLLNKQWIREKIKGENKDVPWNKQKRKHASPNLGDTAKVVLRGKFIVMSTLKKTERPQTT